MAIKLDEARIRLLKVGPSLVLRSDNEGGNIRIYAPNSNTNCYEWDAYNGNLRLYYSTNSGNGAAASWLFLNDGTIQCAKFKGPLEGNATSATKATQDSDGNAINTTYLKRSGGTMGNNAFINWPDSGSWGSDSATFPLSRGGLYWSGTSDWIRLFAEETKSDMLNLVAQFGDDGNSGIEIRNQSGTTTVSLYATGIINATTFNGTLNGNATSASKTTSSLSLNGKSFNGSSPIDMGTLGIAYGGTGATTAAAARGNLGTLSAVSANSFWGMGAPDGATNVWIRTTSLGIIPYQPGGASSLGTSSWPFTEAHIKTVYGNAATATTASKLGSSTIGNTLTPIYLNQGTATVCETFGNRLYDYNNARTYFYSFGGSQDLNWKKVFAASHTATAPSSATYIGATIKGTIYYHKGNYNQAEVDEYPFQMNMVFLSNTSVSNSCTLRVAAGCPDTIIRAVRVSTNSFELQVRQPGDWTKISIQFSYSGSASTMQAFSPVNSSNSSVIAFTTLTNSISNYSNVAAKLTTPRAINGTNFDGSAAITTAHWGTARTLTVGNKGQSVNGSGNISWSLHDILYSGTIGSTSSWDITNPGIYYVAPASNSTAYSGTGNPETNTLNNGTLYRWGQLIVSRANTGGLAQFYISHQDSTDHNIYGIHFRTGWNGSYIGTWRVLLDSVNYTNWCDGRYINTSGDTLTGALNFKNGTWNNVGDDAAMGDCNQAGMFGIKGLNGATGIYFTPYSGSTAQKISINGSGTMTITGTIASTFSGNLTGNVSGSSGSCTGNAATATLLSIHNTVTSTSTRSTNASSWTGGISGVKYMWGQAFKDTSISTDTGDIVFAVRAGQYTSNSTELCVCIDGDYYSMGNKVLHAGNWSSYCAPASHTHSYLPLSGGSISGNVSFSAAASGTSPTAQRISINGVNNDSTVANAPGIGFHIGGLNWGSIKFQSDGSFRFYNNECTAYKPIYGDKVYGAVWNDYAEYRWVLNHPDTDEPIESGRCVAENGNDSMSLTHDRLQAGARIISDTYGMCMGETEKAKTPIAVCGRVLAYPFERKVAFNVGDPVCSGPNGTVSKMSREEAMMYPERIVGTVVSKPTYKEWGPNKIPVKGRIWIQVR